MQDYSSFPSVTEDEFVKDPDVYLERVNQGDGPCLIHNNDGRKLLLFGWEDYWRRFGSLYPVGEKERIEEACRNTKQDEDEVLGDA